MEVFLGDIAVLPVDAVVNAANPRLSGGGGVDGSIHRAAGWEALQEACSAIGGCPVGEVRVTPGFALPCRAIIHAVGPVWYGGARNEESLLASCYRQAMQVVQEEGFRSIAFPAISCGVYRFPRRRAAQIAVREVSRWQLECNSLERVIFCCYDQPMADIYHDLIRRHSRH